MKPATWLSVFVFVLMGSHSAIAFQFENPSSPRAFLDPATLPLLGDSKIHLYTQEAYEGFSPEITQRVLQRYEELVSSGMDTGRHLFDWADLEPSPGVYDSSLVVEEMERRRDLGIEHQFCNFVIIDSEGPTVPSYIETLIDAGVPWDDAVIRTALRNALDHFVPLMRSYDMYMIGLSNEPAGYYEDFPSRAATFQGLIADGIDHIHRISPGLSTTVVFAGPSDLAIPDLMPLIDVASFNQYFYFVEVDSQCQYMGFPLPLFRSSLPSAVGASLDSLIEVSRGKLICIQEIGQATGWNDMPVTLGPFAGLANQRDCYEALNTELQARREHFRTVCNWTLNDFSLEGMAWLRDGLIDQGLPPCFADNIVEIFGPAGVVRSDSTASKKPAFDVFKAGIQFFAQ